VKAAVAVHFAFAPASTVALVDACPMTVPPAERKKIVITSPTADTEVLSADLTIVSPATSTVAVEGGEVMGVPEGGVPVATAVSLMEPFAMSAAVTVYVAVQVSEAPAASVLDGQVIGDRFACVAGAI